MAWLALLSSGLCELVGVTGMQRLTQHHYRSGIALVFSGFGLGLLCLHVAMQHVPMSLAYGVFTAIGALGSSVLGICFWGDSARPARLVCLAAIIAGVVGIKLTL